MAIEMFAVVSDLRDFRMRDALAAAIRSDAKDGSVIGFLAVLDDERLAQIEQRLIKTPQKFVPGQGLGLGRGRRRTEGHQEYTGNSDPDSFHGASPLEFV